MINWVTADEWDKQWNNIYLAHYYPKRIDVFEREVMVDVSFCELQNIIPVPPVSNPTDMSEPGPCERWYASAGDILLWLTHYHHPEQEKLLTSIICLTPPVPEKYRWSFLEKLIDLPNPLLHRIYWIHGYEQANKSIYFRDQSNRVYEVYRAKTSGEATDLLSFLQILKSEYKYYIDKPN